MNFNRRRVGKRTGHGKNKKCMKLISKANNVLTEIETLPAIAYKAKRRIRLFKGDRRQWLLWESTCFRKNPAHSFGALEEKVAHVQ